MNFFQHYSKMFTEYFNYISCDSDHVHHQEQFFDIPMCDELIEDFARLSLREDEKNWLKTPQFTKFTIHTQEENSKDGKRQTKQLFTKMKTMISKFTTIRIIVYQNQQILKQLAELKTNIIS